MSFSKSCHWCILYLNKSRINSDYITKKPWKQDPFFKKKKTTHLFNHHPLQRHNVCKRHTLRQTRTDTLTQTNTHSLSLSIWIETVVVVFFFFLLNCLTSNPAFYSTLLTIWVTKVSGRCSTQTFTRTLCNKKSMTLKDKQFIPWKIPFLRIFK